MMGNVKFIKKYYKPKTKLGKDLKKTMLRIVKENANNKEQGE